ncbi:hypothetical protein KVP10_13655 [Candidimonas humi]|jgi:hypothetical protein|uniref:Bacteriocin-type signal sequence-containing protein n=1 Tax=Candidimonas humi TaxID=683355 RepID=A0ABV8NW36_9BURK|nr:hypothetical protein [Candidimonas humi]MBV6305936.1 hypothetical protein [Candidimonas humi]
MENQQQQDVQELTAAEIDMVSGGLAAPWDYNGEFSYCNLYTTNPGSYLQCRFG